MIIRAATIDDVPALRAIYAPYVTETAVTFEYDVPTEEEFRRRMQVFTQKYPYIVAEEEGKILGYAYAHAFHERAAFQYTVETTVYVTMDCRRGGVGRLLYEELERELKERGYKNMTANISFIDKEDKYLTHDSVRFHERMGFSIVAHFHKCGYKFGRWYDIVWMEKLIGEHD